MAKKVSITKSISDCLKQAQIYEQAFQRLDAIPSTDIEAKRSALEQLETSLVQVSTQAESARERVAAMRETLIATPPFSNGADTTEATAD